MVQLSHFSVSIDAQVVHVHTKIPSLEGEVRGLSTFTPFHFQRVMLGLFKSSFQRVLYVLENV